MRNERPLFYKSVRCKHCGSVLLNHDVRGVMLTERQRKIYDFIRENQPCSTKDVAQHLFAEDKDGGPTHALTMMSVYVKQINEQLVKIRQKIIGGRHGGGYRIMPIEVK